MASPSHGPTTTSCKSNARPRPPNKRRVGGRRGRDGAAQKDGRGGTPARPCGRPPYPSIPLAAKKARTCFSRGKRII
jgi:hypothetical protein